uniref:Protein MIX23 n=1 Tax=Globodera pallida TaxID=36090 RepID=A0A183CM88_GLOPA
MGTINSDSDAFLCRDIGEFKRVIDKLRADEDKIILRLNCEFPTKSFSKKLDKQRICEDIQKSLTEMRKMREHLLQRCLRENSSTLDQCKSNPPSKMLALKTAKANLRLIREEITVEEIVRSQADTAIQARCRKELLI